MDIIEGGSTMNIIFLDIDGVLNGYNKYNLFGWKMVSKLQWKPLIKLYRKLSNPFGVHKLKVKRLAKIVKATNAKIVMSSSWRHGWWNTPYEKQWKDQKKLTDLFNKYHIEVIDITPSLSHGLRGLEIKQWLDCNRDKVNNFVILDDENSDMHPYKYSTKFIQTSDIEYDQIIIGHPSENTGLKNKHVKEAIKILLADKNTIHMARRIGNE